MPIDPCRRHSTAPVPFDYVRDDARRRILVTVHGPIRSADMCVIVDRQVDEHAWTYGLLYDLRRLTTPLPNDGADALAAHVFQYVISHGPRGPVAAVTSAASMVGAVQHYAHVVERAGVTMQVFWDMDEAEKWLAHQVSREHQDSARAAAVFGAGVRDDAATPGTRRRSGSRA
jgi:hypothetical protein